MTHPALWVFLVGMAGLTVGLAVGMMSERAAWRREERAEDRARRDEEWV